MFERNVPKRVACLAVIALMVSFAIGNAASTSGDVSSQFGSRVSAYQGKAQPFLSGDFDGDGKPDAAYLVTVAPAAKNKAFAANVSLVDSLFGTPPLGSHGESLALAIALSSNQRRFLIASYGEGGSGYFDSPIWKSKPLPLSVATRGSKAFRGFAKQDGHIRNDVVVLGTEAGIDTALYWDGRKFVLFSPPEEP